MTVPNFLRENTELKLKKLNKVDEFGAYFSIPFVTDVHNAETTTYKWLNSIRVIEEVNKRKNINYILTGGDYINNHDDKEEVIKRLKNFKDRFEDRSNLFITLGNHDNNSNYKDFSKVITHSEMKKIMFSDMQDVTLGNGLYYYKDFHEHKIRLIVLNSEDIPEYDIGMKYKGQWDYAFSNEQLNWVAHTALNTDYKIIFCSHTPMVENVEGFDYPIKNAEAMLGIMKAYTLGESYSGSNTTGNFKYNVSVYYNKKGTIVCCLFGHVHADNIVYKDNIAHISTTCSNCSYRYGSSHVENATGTVNEIALDFLTVRNDMGFLTRFGAGSDRSFTYVNNTKESKKEKSYPGIKLLGQNKKIIALLQNLKDLSIESILESGDKTLSFSYAKDDKFYENIIEENYIRTKEDEFVIKSRDIGVDYTRFDCVLNLEELEANVFDRFESVEQTITNALNLAIVGTEWTVNDNTLKKKRTVRCTNKNALEIVKEIKKTYRVDIVFNTLEKKIEIYEKLGEDKGAYFIDSLNLTALQVQSDSYKFSTRIIAEGKDNLTFEDINGGKNYVENFQYSKKIKTIYWKDERYTIKESLLEDAKAKLEEISKPFTSYNASVLNLAELNPKYKSILDYSLGDTITLLSKSNKVRDKQRIVKTVEYPQDHSRDTVELANAILKFEDIQQENQETTDTVNNITTDNGTVDGSTIDSIQVKQIEDFKANVIEVVNFKAINASIDNLHANKADIQDLNAVKAKIGTLEATKANITQLNAVSAEISKLDTLKANIVDLNSATAKIGVLEAKTASIDNLLSQKASINDLNALNATISEALIKKATIAQLEALETKTNNLIADKANIKDLNVTNANINKIQAETANIKTLLNGNLSSENIQAGGITSDKLTIANGFITNLMISSVSASKITAGTIDAAKINVVNLNADNLTVGKINGQLLKDGSISGLAIENGAIDNNKVSPNANIEASKINISSVVTAINEGSTLLTANKVTIDSEKGTLDVAFNNLNTSLEANKKITESNSTAINVVQGKLSASIENSKVLEGKQKTLEDNYNRTVITVDSLKNTVGQQKTLIDLATGKITSVEVKANTLEKNLSGLTQTVTDTKKVIENNKTVLESKNAELKANIDKVSSSLSSVSSTVDKNNKTLVAKTNTLEQNLSGLSQTVANNKTVIDGKITSVEGETHELKAGLGGLTSKLDTLKSTTDGINKTVSNQGSVINQLKDSIKLKVDSSTFTQSTTVINNNINKAKEDAITTANNNISNAIDNLKIGGRNLAQLTEPKEYSSFTGRVNDCQMGYEILLDTLNVDDPVTVSYTFSYENLVPVNNHNDYGIWLQGCGDVTEWNSGGFPGGSRLTPKINWGTGHSGSFKVEYTFKLEANAKKNKKWFTSFRMDYIQSGKVSVKEFMVEYGTKANAYIQAPEDLQVYADKVAKAKADLAKTEAIANADGKITEEERKRIQQAQENLNTAIAKSTEAETKAKSYADTKKQEAIKAAENLALEKSNIAKKYAEDVAVEKANLAKIEAIANADGKISAEEKKRIQQAQKNLNAAISKADKAKQDAILEANKVAELKKQEAINSANSHADGKATEALNNAKAFINAEITTVNSHLNKATSEINILKNQIESKVSQSDINKSIEEIKFSDVNLILNSGNFNNTNHWSNNGGNPSLEKKDGFNCLKSTGSIKHEKIKLEHDTSYIYWCEIMFDANVEVNGTVPLHHWLNSSGNAGDSACYGYEVLEGLGTAKANTWHKIVLRFKTKPTTEFRDDIFLTPFIYKYPMPETFWLKYISLTKGNKFIDGWTPNPLDVDQSIINNIKTVTDKISTVESTLVQKTNSIEAGVRDLNSTTQTITTNVSNINRDLTSKINSNLNAAKSFATDIAIAKANLAKEQAIANADGKITAEEQKRIQQAQANLNTAIAKATEAETKAKSYADVKKQEAINSANNNTNNAINNIKIGGRNYGLNTDVMQQEPYNIIFSKDLVFEKGKTYTISMDFDLENLVKGSQERVGCEGSILFKDGTRQYIGLWHWISQGATFKGRKSYTFTIENKDIKDNMTSIHIYTELVSSGKRNLGRFKIEEGNKATDYNIAPEDLQSYADKVAKAKADLAQANAIANADGKITEEERKRIQQAQENLNTAIARADKAKQDAINAASTDATNKTNNALNSAKAYVNAEITTVNTKVNNVESNINILKNKIESKVSQSDIDKSIQEIKIGGRNLIVNSDILQNLFSPLSGYSGTREVINDEYALCKKDVVFKCTHAGTGFHLPLFTKNSNRIGKTYTWSFWAKCSVNKRGTIGHESNGQTQVEFTTEWKKFSHTWLFGDCTYSSFTFYIGWNVGEVLYIRDFKIEEGTKATDWTPAPEDTNQLVVDSIKVVDTKISNVSSNVTQLKDSVETQINSINSKTHTIETTLGGKASKQEVTEVNNRVATIKANLDSITQRVSNTESKTNSLETNINGRASKQELTVVNNKVTEVTANLNGITQRVGNTESRINNLDGKVANTVTNQQFTEFKQSNDKFKFTVEQRSSVSNILPNSSFFGGDRGWLHNGAEFWSGPYSGYGFKGRMTGAIKNRTGYNNPERFLQTHKAYKVKKNTTYTISFHYACEMNIQSMEAYVVLSDTEHGDYAQPIRILEKPGGTQSDPNNEIPFTYKFNTGNHEWVWLRFDHNGMKPGTNWDQYCWLYVSEIGIYEGDVGAVKWIPKGGEVYSANYQMDGLGFKGTFEDGTYAYLGKDGLEWYNAGTGHAYHALTYVTSFDIPVGNPGKAYIKLPAEFTKRRSSLKWTVALRGYYYNTTGNFFPFHVHCTGARDYIENGLVVCEVQGLCKIQNGSNSGDVQFRPLTAMLIAIA